jgi:uracil phosphoribosyltransferase
VTRRRLVVLDHPIVQDRLTSLRDVATSNATFRRIIGELSALVAYEALSDLTTEAVVVDTPVATAASCRRVSETIVLVPVLRAGLGMVPAVQAIAPFTEVTHVGLRRDEGTLVSEVYLNRLPAQLGSFRVVVCDPMLATGGSLGTVCDLVFARGARRVEAICIIASEPGLAWFHARHPDVRVTCAAVDPQLDERGFIVPGLGDAGDRLFGIQA